MIKLADAISNRFPQGNDWAAQALRALEGGLDPATPVHDVVEGWTRREPADAEAQLVDTLFVLSADRLGLGQVGGAPRWVELVDIAAIDAVDNSPLPLQTIEIELVTGETVCVGWPEAFSDALVDVLVGIATGAAPSATTDELYSATALDEVSADEESSAPGPKPIVAAIDFLNPAIERPAPEAPSPEEPQPAPWSSVHEFDEFDEIGPPPVTEPVSLADPGMFSFDVAAADPTVADESVADAWFTVGAPDAEDPAPTPSAFADAPDLTMPAPEPVAAAPVASSEPAPWLTPGMTWPDPLRGVVYLGGHPSHPRKRKNGTMVFSPRGLEVRGGGFHDWEMAMDWGYVDQLDVQGPDEIMFGDQLKIDASSSAVIVVMNDGTRMFFEVRTRRPPSLRSAMAPMLLMVDNIRSWRVQQG